MVPALPTASVAEQSYAQQGDELFLIEADHRLAIDDRDWSRLEPKIEQFL
jgi:hypothetical protein